MFDKYLEILSSVKLGGIGDNLIFPPVDTLTVTTNHFDAAGRYTGQDLAIVSLVGAEMIVSVIIVITIITFFLIKRRK